MNREILRLTVPNIVTNLTVPLLGMADVAVAGRSGGAGYIGAIAVGTAVFNAIYWNFGFLRMGTSGFAAQAYGARDRDETVSVMIRALSVSAYIVAADSSGCSLFPGVRRGRDRSFGARLFPCESVVGSGYTRFVRVQGMVHRHAGHPYAYVGIHRR